MTARHLSDHLSVGQAGPTCVRLRPPVSLENTAVAPLITQLFQTKKTQRTELVGKAGGGWRSIFEINMQGANSGTAQSQYKG